MKHRHTLVAVMAAALLFASDAVAQDAPSLSEEQLELYLQANEALREEEPRVEDAAKLLERALEEGDRFAVLVLALGRSYQLMDECPAATRHFNEFEVAPMDPRSDRAALVDLRDYYLEQMKSLCSARLTVECSDPEIQLSISDQTPTCGEEIKLRPGTYDLSATLGEARRTSTITLEGNQQLNYRVELEEAVDTSIPPDTTVPTPGPTDTGGALSRSTVVVGVSTVIFSASASTFWLLARRSHDRTRLEYAAIENKTEEDFERLESEAKRYGQREVIAGWATAAGLAIGGVATAGLLVRDLRSQGTRAPDKKRAMLIVSPMGVGIRASF